MNYTRVIPRDLFNESKLLKCMGRLCLNILDGKTPVPIEVVEEDECAEGFTMHLSYASELMIANIRIKIKGTPVAFWTTYNSKSNYPFFCGRDETESIEVFTDEGEYTEEFITYCKEL
jgi:hypothetical protein